VELVKNLGKRWLIKFGKANAILQQGDRDEKES